MSGSGTLLRMSNWMKSDKNAPADYVGLTNNKIRHPNLSYLSYLHYLQRHIPSTVA